MGWIDGLDACFVWFQHAPNHERVKHTCGRELFTIPDHRGRGKAPCNSFMRCNIEALASIQPLRRGEGRLGVVLLHRSFGETKDQGPQTPRHFSLSPIVIIAPPDTYAPGARSSGHLPATLWLHRRGASCGAASVRIIPTSCESDALTHLQIFSRQESQNQNARQ